MHVKKEGILIYIIIKVVHATNVVIVFALFYLVDIVVDCVVLGNKIEKVNINITNNKKIVNL